MANTPSVITLAGLAAAARAGQYGPKIEVTKVKIGSSIITSSINSNMTDVTNSVWEGGTDVIRYQVVSDTVVMFKITLDESVGNFDIGNIGLFLSDGTMFTITALPKVSYKQKTEGSTVGNRRIFNIPVILSGIAEITNLSILIADEANVPQVNTEQDLPDPISAPFSVYEVLYHTDFGCPVLAIRVDSNWWYIPAQLSVGSGTQFDPNQFDPTEEPKVGELVRLDTTSGLFKKADSNDIENGYMGIRGENNTILFEGLYKNPNSTPSSPAYIVGQKYWAAGGVDAGKTTTTPTAWYVGIACTPDSLLLKKQNINMATTSYPGQVKLATIEEAQAGTSDSVITSAVLSKASNTRPNELSNGQFYALSTNNVPSDFTLVPYGNSQISCSSIIHSRSTWIEGPNYYLRFLHSTIDSSSTNSYSTLYQRISTASKYSTDTKCISFRGRSQVTGQQVIVGARINFGTGGAPSSPLNLDETTVLLTTSFATYEVSFTIPDISQYTYGTNNDDYIEYYIGFPCTTPNYVDIDWIKLEYGSFASPINENTPEYTSQNLRAVIHHDWTFNGMLDARGGITTGTGTNSTFNGDTVFAGNTLTQGASTFNGLATFNGEAMLNSNVRIKGTLTCEKTIEGTARAAYYAD